MGFWMRFILMRSFPFLPSTSYIIRMWADKQGKRAKAIWDFEGIHCTSRHIPGVKFAGLIHPGILGCAPSAEILAEWNRREAELISEKAADGTTTRTVANPPLTTNTHAGAADEAAAAKIAAEGARTVPGRPEHGGNCDIKNLSRGSKVYLPVHVPGAKFSVGDLHFSRRPSFPPSSQRGKKGRSFDG